MKITTPVKALIIYCLFSGAAIILLSTAGEGNFFWIKDAAILLVLSLAALNNIERLAYFSKKYYILLIPALLFSILNSSATLFLQAASFRQIAIPFALLAIGYSLVNKKNQLIGIAKTTILAMMFIAVFGFFERLTLLWNFVDIRTFFTSKNIPVFEYGYPVFWIEPISILGYKTFDNGIPRMVSLILDPVNLGHLLVFAISLTAHEWRNLFSRRTAIVIIFTFFVALILTLSKGAFLHFFISLIALNPRVGIYLKIIVAVLAAPLVYVYATQHAGFLVHLHGFIRVSEYISLFGSGLGSFGNYSSMYSESAGSGVGDSYWAAIIGQLGIIGFAIWISVFYKVCKKIGRTHFISSLLIGQVFVAALSENTFNLMSVFLLMTFSGAYLRLETQKRLFWKGSNQGPFKKSLP